MRLDKFLQVSRLVKRRALANQLCDAGRVRRGGRRARASAEVAPADEICIDYGWRRLTIRVVEVPTGQVHRADASALYTVLSEERTSDPPPEP